MAKEQHTGLVKREFAIIEDAGHGTNINKLLIQQSPQSTISCKETNEPQRKMAMH